MSNSENKREIQKEVLVLTANIYIITECLQLPLRHTDQDSFPPSVWSPHSSALWKSQRRPEKGPVSITFH